MQAFRITGSFLMGANWTNFTTEIAAKDEAAAREQIISTIGSRHRANRRQVKIEKIAPIQGEAITDIVVAAKVSGASK